MQTSPDESDLREDTIEFTPPNVALYLAKTGAFDQFQEALEELVNNSMVGFVYRINYSPSSRLRCRVVIEFVCGGTAGTMLLFALCLHRAIGAHGLAFVLFMLFVSNNCICVFLVL